MAEISIKDINMIGFSQVTDDEILNFVKAYGAHHYKRLNLVVRKAEGVWLTDIKDKKYLDCLAAYSAANQGHHHPRIVRAVVEALLGGCGSVVSNMVYSDPLGIFSKKIATLVPQLGPRFGENGNNFHGRMITVVSFSSTPKYKTGFGPLTPGFVTVDYGDSDAVEKAINKNTCGILVEPMQGEGGMYIPPDGFLKQLREIADRHNLLLIFDEIQVGLGRTGKMFCFEHENVIPDGVVLGKAISGGVLPLSVFVTNSALMDIAFQPGSDGSTFGGYPLACVAGIAALDVIVEEKLPAKSAEKGEILKKKIMEIAAHSPHVKEVRGCGLFIGIEMKGGDAISYCRKLLDLGILANDSHGHTIRISPPLIINDNEIDYLAERLERVLID